MIKDIRKFIVSSVVVGFTLVTAPASSALVLNSAMTITDVVTVQPIILSDTGGGNTANYFGDASQSATIMGHVDSIWAQAGIDVNFLSANTWNNTFANSGNGSDPRPQSDLNTIATDGDAAGVSSGSLDIINMYFVLHSAGHSLLSANSAAGLASLPGNTVTQYVGTNLLGFAGGLEVIASVVAHEIGHNLGLGHFMSGGQNLLQPGSSSDQGERLTAGQISTALASNLSASVTPVPIPPAIALFLSGLAIFGFMRRKRQQQLTVA